MNELEGGRMQNILEYLSDEELIALRGKLETVQDMYQVVPDDTVYIRYVKILCMRLGFDYCSHTDGDVWTFCYKTWQQINREIFLRRARAITV